MTSFSDRNALGRDAGLPQLRSIDNALRTAIWNCFYLCLEQNDGVTEYAFQFFAFRWMNSPVDSVPGYESKRREPIRDNLNNCNWNEVFDFVELAIEFFEKPRKKEFINILNEVLQAHVSAYRVVGDQVIESTTSEEVATIEQALSGEGFSGPRAHIRNAAKLLFDRQSPDNRNSIKESISAIEGAARTITGRPSATLGEALSKIEERYPVHPAMKKAFTTLYGYTSDAAGVRHGMIDDEEAGFAEAKYMLVSCAAFLNYLIDVSKS